MSVTRGSVDYLGLYSETLYDLQKFLSSNDDDGLEMSVTASASGLIALTELVPPCFLAV